MILRASALVVMLSLSAAAAGPLLCQIGCMSPELTSQPCHDAGSGARVSAADHACDLSADKASLSGPALKFNPLTRHTQVAEPHVFGSGAAAAVFARHSHRPPDAAPSRGFVVRAVLRI